jgi:hypothetical protein
MAIKIDNKLTPQKLVPAIERMFELSAPKISSLEKTWDSGVGAPVFTVKGRYWTRGWTAWTEGFQFGSAILQFDATGDKGFLEIGRRKTIELMASHVSHVGVHDHGFNNISTYGNLLRLMHEGRIEWNDREKDFYELALKVSGAVQAARWTKLVGRGFIHSFNGPHSLFVDTIRSLRSLAVADRLGHDLRSEQERRVSLLDRLIQHAMQTARYSVYYGVGRDAYDVRGRVAHEFIFNVASGSSRCPNSQQGFSPFSTWTRGLAWAMCGFAEQLEFFATLRNADVPRIEPAWFEYSDYPVLGLPKAIAKRSPLAQIQAIFLNAATAAADFYMATSCADGVPMWDTGAPNLHRLPSNYLNKPSDPYNAHEPADSSAAAIAAQGLIRLGNYLLSTRNTQHATRYRQAGLTIARTLLAEPYLSTNPKHQGLLLHSVYHRPNGWDYIAPGQKVPNGESSMWGDYHLRELALLILREAKGLSYLTFFGCVPK